MWLAFSVDFRIDKKSDLVATSHDPSALRSQCCQCSASDEGARIAYFSLHGEEDYSLLRLLLQVIRRHVTEGKAAKESHLAVDTDGAIIGMDPAKFFRLPNGAAEIT